MKKLIFLFAILLFNSFFAQFSVKVSSGSDFTSKEAILFTLDGSKDIISSKEIRNGNTWIFKVSKPYTGMMKIYFPDSNYSFNLIAENKNVDINLKTSLNKVVEVIYLDTTNILMEKVQELQNKNQLIFPALVQIKEYYSPSSTFGKAISMEIARLGEKPTVDPAKNPFVSYYHINYNKFVVENSAVQPPSQAEIVDFITRSGELLETSSLLRPILVNYLNAAGNTNTDQAVDLLLSKLVLETPRGQTVLSEFIDIFGAYGMNTLKDKYLAQANGLKCTINARLASTIQSNKNVEMGAIFPNVIFTNLVKNTKVKSLLNVRSAKKVIMFWASTCSHCEKDLPVILGKYSTLKSKDIEVIGFSLDNEKAAFEDKVNALPWINDSELRGWKSSYAETYNVSATPTYFILDENDKIIAKPESISEVFTFLGVK